MRRERPVPAGIRLGAQCAGRRRRVAGGRRRCTAGLRAQRRRVLRLVPQGVLAVVGKRREQLQSLPGVDAIARFHVMKLRGYQQVQAVLHRAAHATRRQEQFAHRRRQCRARVRASAAWRSRCDGARATPSGRGRCGGSCRRRRRLRRALRGHQPVDLRAGQWAAQIGKGAAAGQEPRRVVLRAPHQEGARLERRHQLVKCATVRRAARHGAGESFDDARLVALGLQAADQPGARVAEAAIVEVDRILCRQQATEAEGARLLEQRQHRRLGRRVGGRREVTKDLVHVEQRAQGRGAALPPHPGDQLVEHQRDDEHALGIVQVGDGNDADARLAVTPEQQALRVEGFALRPGREAGRGQQAVHRHGQLKPLLRGIEGLEVEGADLFDAGLLYRLDQASQVETGAVLPAVLDQARE